MQTVKKSSKHKIKEVGALTVIQPWAYVILRKGKNVENRQKNSHYRGTVVIHASATNSKGWFEECPISVRRDSVPFGAIVGFAELTDVITKDQVTPQTKTWFEGKYGYVLTNVMILKTPIFTKGKRGLWKLSGKALNSCLDQLSPAQLKRLKPLTKRLATKK
jgi:hypothetical protein